LKVVADVGKLRHPTQSERRSLLHGALPASAEQISGVGVADSSRAEGARTADRLLDRQILAGMCG